VFDYDAARENPPEGDTCVEVTFNPVNKDGCRSDYFCSPHCLVEFAGGDLNGRAIDLDPARLHELYWQEEMTLQQIAEKFGVSPDTVHDRMKEYDIPRRTRSSDRPEKQVLVYLYWKEHETIRDIAEQFDVSHPSVLRWMDEYDIPRREKEHELNKK
jgi:transposase-like protein